MKRILFAGASLFALMAGSASAATTTFGYTGTIAYYTVPLAGEYQVITYGAQGGNGGTIGGGGRGAKIGADFSLGAGDVLEIVVGGRGESGKDGGGRGDGTFVINAGNGLPLVIAGGGGGGTDGIKG